ncbi:MAG: hypothetical protein AAF328_10150 [Planctomycetota bacterium]
MRSRTAYGFTVVAATASLLMADTTHAALVQITQSGNRATTLVDNLSGDLTGDGIDDVTAAVTTNYLIAPDPSQFEVVATINGDPYSIGGGGFFGINAGVAAGGAPFTQPLGSSAQASHYFPIVFSDAAYGLTGEDGWVEVFLRADDTEPEESGIEFRRLVFDPDARGTPGFDENLSYPEAIAPEPAVALLLGSAALVALRRRRSTLELVPSS